jgi:hypothetical protein
MLIYVNPARFEDKLLLLRPSGLYDYHVMVDGLLAGRITKADRAALAVVWTWSLTGPNCAVPGCEVVIHDDVNSLSGAKAAIKSAFLQWLTWARAEGTRGRKVPWMG